MEPLPSDMLINDDDNKIVGHYSVKINDSYTMRIIFEIVSAVITAGVGVIKFEPEGISCVAATGNMKVLVVSTFKAKRLLHYEQSGFEVDSPIEAYLKFSDMVDILRSYARKDIILMKAFYNSQGRVVDMSIYNDSNINSVDNIMPLASGVQEIYTNLYEEYYHDCSPTVNITAHDFSQIVTKLKTRKCTKMEFEVVNDGVLIKGHQQDVVITAYHILNNSEVTGVDEDMDIPYEPIKTGSVRLTVIKNNCVAVDLKDNIAWIFKISKACANNSVINIYLRESAPLVIGATNGVMGESYYGFTHCDI